MLLRLLARRSSDASVVLRDGARQWRAGRPRPAVPSTVKLLVVGLLDQMFDDAVRFVDVLQRATTQSMGKIVTFSFRDVMMRLVKPVSYTHLDVYKRQLLNRWV